MQTPNNWLTSGKLKHGLIEEVELETSKVISRDGEVYEYVKGNIT